MAAGTSVSPVALRCRHSRGRLCHLDLPNGPHRFIVASVLNRRGVAEHAHSVTLSIPSSALDQSGGGTKTEIRLTLYRRCERKVSSGLRDEHTERAAHIRGPCGISTSADRRLSRQLSQCRVLPCSAGVEVAAQGFTNDVGGGYAVPFGSLGDLIVEFWIEADGLDGRRACAAERGSSALAAAGDDLDGVVAAFGFVGKGVDVGVGDDAFAWVRRVVMVGAAFGTSVSWAWHGC